MDLRLHVVVDTCEVQTLTDTLIGILEVVLTHEGHMHLMRGVALFLEEVVPRFHGRSLTHRNADLTHDSGIKTLLLHTHWHLIDRGHVLALHDALQIDITERRHLHAQMVIKVALRT